MSTIICLQCRRGSPHVCAVGNHIVPSRTVTLDLQGLPKINVEDGSDLQVRERRLLKHVARQAQRRCVRCGLVTNNPPLVDGVCVRCDDE